MKKLIIIILIFEILICGVIISIEDSIIVGNYNKDSIVYDIISTKIELPKSAIVKCIVKGRFIFSDNISYKVYYKTDKMYTTIFRLETTNDGIRILDKYSVGIELYCLLFILLTILIFFILKKVRK